MAYREPTRAKLAAAEREIMIRRGDRILAAEAAAKAKAEAAKSRPPVDPTVQPTFVMGAPKSTGAEMQAAAAAYRANYANFDEKIQKLMEARLAAALTADGYKVPPIPAADRLRDLKARQLR